MGPREKSRIFPPFAAEQSVLSSPVCLGIIAKNGHLSRISGEGRREFSAVQTAWRRGKDSNPRYRSETCKSRRVRKLHGIKSFKNSLRLPASRGVVANRSGLRRSSKANPWRFCGLNWSPQGSEFDMVGLVCDCLPSGQSQHRTFLRWKDQLEAGISNNIRLSCSHLSG